MAESSDAAARRPVFILNCAELPCYLVMQFVFRELCKGFELRGHVVREVSRIEDITNDGIVFLGQDFRSTSPARVLESYVKVLAAHAPDAIYIGWYWQDIDSTPLPYFILTHENHLRQEADPDTHRWALINASPHHCPLLLRASEAICRIGTYPRGPIEHDFCYMGCPYLADWIPRAPFHGVYASGNWSAYWPSEKRRETYLKSHFALGFQAPMNCITEHVSQRIYEGMAYGCIVLTNSEAARNQTEGIAQLVTSRDDIEEKMRLFLASPDETEALRQRGYDFIKRAGTCEHAVARYVQFIANDFGLQV